MNQALLSCLNTGECWSEAGDVLYVSRVRFTRGQAKQAFASLSGEWFPDVRCRRVFMREASESEAWECGFEDGAVIECPREVAEIEAWRVSLAGPV